MSNLLFFNGASFEAPLIIPDIEAWYDASSDNYLTLSGTAITQMLDRSGNSNHTDVQATSTKRPTVETNSLNGRQTASFDGGDTLELPSALYALANGANTMFVVTKTSIANTEQRIVSFTEAASMRNGIEYLSTGSSIAYYNKTSYAGVAFTEYPCPTDFAITTGSYDNSTTVTISVAGATPVTASQGIAENGVDAGFLGSGADVGRYLTGNIAEVIMYSRELSATEKSLVEVYLANKWGLYHPLAGWINNFTTEQQAMIHAGQLNKDNAIYEYATLVDAWYDFTSAAFLTLSSTAITQALDKSGNDNDTDVQGTAAARPTWTSNQQNTLSGAVLDGGDFLTLPSALYSIPQGDNTVIVVAKRSVEDASFGIVYSMGESGVNNGNLLLYNVTAGQVIYRNSQAVGSSPVSSGNTNTDFNILRGRREGTTQAVSVNNGTETTNTNATDPTTVDIGYIGQSASGSLFLTGAIEEIFILNDSATTAQLAAFEGMLASKYNITLA